MKNKNIKQTRMSIKVISNYYKRIIKRIIQLNLKIVKLRN